MMQITFSGSAAEIRDEMKILLGLNDSPLHKVAVAIAEQTVDQQVEEAFGEVKRTRGRPRKAEPTVEAAPVETVTITPEPETIPEPVTIEVVAAPEPVVEQPAAPAVPGNAQDLMTAAMEIVKGDSAKKIALVKLLGSFGAKTINTLAPESYAEFWEKVNAL